MTDLNKLRKKEPYRKYLIIRKGRPSTFISFNNRIEAVRKQEKLNYESEVLTFREAAIKYPEHFVFDYSITKAINRNGGRKKIGDEVKSFTIALRIPPSINEKLNALKDKMGKSRNEVIETAIDTLYDKECSRADIL